MQISQNQVFFLEALGSVAASTLSAREWEDASRALCMLWDQSPTAKNISWSCVEHIARAAWEKARSPGAATN